MPRPRRLRLALLCCLGLAWPSSATTPDPLLRHTDRGPVQGFRPDPRTDAWLGLPYAQPPLGALRWRAPRPAAGWGQPRAATAFAPPCSQPRPVGGDAAAPRHLGSEDCLYLNVWSPAGATGLPVMVWIHGGANRFGSGAIDPRALVADQRVVVVAINYRLGVFGWFRHPQLHPAGADADDRSGNFGTLDQIAALDWVRRNIAAFGGDPANVTVFGESAGGTNVLALLASRAAGTLFDKAIAQSGNAVRGFSVAAAENAVDAADPGHPLSAQEILLQRLVDDGAAGNRAHALALYHTLPAAEVSRRLYASDFAQLTAAAATLHRRHFPNAGVILHPQLFRDGHVLPAQPVAAALAVPNGSRGVAVMLGATRDEARLFLAYNHHFAQPRPGPGHAVAIPDRHRFETAAAYENRLWTWAGVDAPANALNRWREAGVFAYRFDWDDAPAQPWLGGLRPGALHGLDVPFVFGRIDDGTFPLLADAFDDGRRAPARRLSAAIMSYWGEFARRGDPGRGRDGDLPRWQPWTATPAGANVMLLDAPPERAIRMVDDRVDRAALLERLAADPAAGATTVARCRLLRQMVEGGFASFEWRDYDAFAGGRCAPVR